MTKQQSNKQQKCIGCPSAKQSIILSVYTKGETIMVTKQDFALEQLENRLEMFCVYVPYIGTCSKKVLWWTVYYPCVKTRRICF